MNNINLIEQKKTVNVNEAELNEMKEKLSELTTLQSQYEELHSQFTQNQEILSGKNMQNLKEKIKSHKKKITKPEN